MKEIVYSFIAFAIIVSIVEPEAIGRWYSKVSAGFDAPQSRLLNDTPATEWGAK